MICDKCGSNNIESAAFCSQCGSPLNKTAETNLTMQPVNNSYSAPQQPATYPTGNNIGNNSYPPAGSPANNQSTNYPGYSNNIYLQAGNDSPVSVGDWIVTIIVMSIPLVGFIMLFVWAFGRGANKSKANYCKAVLIFTGIVLGLYLLAFLIFGASVFTALSGSGSYF